MEVSAGGQAATVDMGTVGTDFFCISKKDAAAPAKCHPMSSVDWFVDRSAQGDKPATLQIKLQLLASPLET